MVLPQPLCIEEGRAPSPPRPRTHTHLPALLGFPSGPGQSRGWEGLMVLQAQGFRNIALLHTHPHSATPRSQQRRDYLCTACPENRSAFPDA